MNLVVLFSVIGCVSAATYPKEWELCKNPASRDGKRSKCVERTITNIIAHLAKDGEPSLGMVDLEPMKIRNLTIGHDAPGSPLSLKIEVGNVVVNGFSGIDILRVDGHFSSPENWNIHVVIDAHNFTVTGTYNVNGRFLLVPLVGRGKCQFKLYNNKAEVWVKGAPNVKADGKTYMKVVDSKMTIDPEIFILNLENLLGGGSLGKSVNDVLNENWKVLWSEARGAVETEIIDVIVGYAKNIYDSIPYDDLRLKDE